MELKYISSRGHKWELYFCDFVHSIEVFDSLNFFQLTNIVSDGRYSFKVFLYFPRANNTIICFGFNSEIFLGNKGISAVNLAKPSGLIQPL